MFFLFFFFKQKTAYEMQRGLVGSEMCIRDRVSTQSTWELARQKVDRERKQREVRKICEDSDELKELNEKIKLAYLNKERAAQLAEEQYRKQREIDEAVSYTHLTLPTILLVQISVVAVSLKKKNEDEQSMKGNNNKTASEDVGTR
eukprot:TRINITY_DN54603_c0_g1_i1.p2 TRINITY_DN54603_c0_g1~~TRINITY_DN54603_c0_g1_i1.p2  ORF type:complete len:146 (-),score=57.86 TRINITY_DN54603_c0_g1_i1:19-456(-)